MSTAEQEDVPVNLLHGIFAKLDAAGICDEPPVDIYAGGMADFYDGFMTEYVSDIPIFEQYAKGPGSSVLDLASGAGRISLPLARRGMAVDGVELSPAMIEIAAQKLAQEVAEVQSRVNFIHGNMTDFHLNKKYDLILIGITSISLLLSSNLRRGLFKCVAEHLKEDGVLVFDTLDLEGDNWRKFDFHLDAWNVSTSKELDYGIIGQRFYPAAERFVFNVFREVVDWDGTVTRRIGHSEKAMIYRTHLTEELATASLVIKDEKLVEDQRYYIVGRK